MCKSHQKPAATFDTYIVKILDLWVGASIPAMFLLSLCSFKEMIHNTRRQSNQLWTQQIENAVQLSEDTFL